MNRFISEGALVQGINEQIAYQIVTTPWGSSPSSGSVSVTDITNGGTTDVTSTVMPTGSLSISGDTITLPVLKSLTVNRNYRINVQFTSGGNVFVALAQINSEY